MKQVVLRSGQALVVDVPAPAVAPGGVLVRVSHSVISSGTERVNLQSSGESVLSRARRRPELAASLLRQAWRNGLGPTLEKVRRKLDAERPAGYTCAGTVVAPGAGVTDLPAGTAVACAGGGYAVHAEYVWVPRNLVAPIPEGVTAAAGASVAIGAIALQGVRQAAIELGDRVVVTGLGLIGLLTVQLARAAGGEVLAVDPLPERRKLALTLGAAHAAGPGDAAALVAGWTAGLGADRVLLTAATPSDGPLRQAMELVRQRGTVVVVGDVGLGLTRSPFYEKEVELRISCSYGPGRYDPSYEEGGLDYPAGLVRWTENRNMAAYLELLRAGSVRWEPLASRTLPVDQAGQAYADLESGAPPLAITLTYTPDGPPDHSAGATVASPALVRRSGVVRLGIVGAGEFVRSMHLPQLLRLPNRFSVVAVANRTGLSARSAAQQAGAPFWTTEVQALLERPEVDAVLIATRHHLHAELAIAALEAGKAVFLEKPLAVEPEELDRLLPVIAGSDQPFLAGFNRRFSPAAALLAERIAAHAAPPVLLYRVNAGPPGKNDWTLGPEGGGRAVGEACHMVDLLEFLGGPFDPAIGVVAAGSSWPDADFSAQFRHTGGAAATLVYTVRGNAGLPKEHLEAFLGGEAVVLEDFRHVVGYGRGRPSRRSTGKGHAEIWEAFYRACTTGDRLPIPLDSLASVARATFRIRALARGGQDSSSSS